MKKIEDLSNSNLFEKIMGVIVAIPFLVLGALNILIPRKFFRTSLMRLMKTIEQVEAGSVKHTMILYAILFGGTILMAFPTFHFCSSFIGPSEDLKIFSVLLPFTILIIVFVIVRCKKN